MKNKIFLKIGAVFVFIVCVYLSFIIFVISPKVTKYLVDFETNQVKQQLDKVSTIIASREEQLNEFKTLKERDYRQKIREISYLAYNIASSYNEMFKEGLYTKEKASNSALSIISKIEYGHDDYIYVINTKGEVLYHPTKEYIGQNIYNLKDAKGKIFIPTVIKNSIEEKETYTRYSWEKPNSKATSDKLVHSIYFEPFDMIISSAVYDSNIEIEIEAQKDKTIKKLRPLIDSLLSKENSYIYILDKNYNIIMHPNKELLKDSSKSFENTISFKSFENAYKNGKVWEYSWNKNNIDDKKLAWIKYNDFFEWYIVSSVYKKDLEKKADEIDSLIINLSVILLLVLMSIAILFVQKLLRPIEVLTKNAELVKNGNLNTRANINSDDELGILASHFNRMLDYIQENTRSLEEKITERTMQIRTKLYYDELTGLKNRESLTQDLRKDDMVALTFIDINNFDDINELYGFEIGNEVLIKVMEVLKEFSLKNELELYRVAGDIFALKDTNIGNFIRYEQLLSEIHEIFGKEFTVDSLGIDLFLSVSLGVSISQNDSIKSANIALKKAKQMGYKTMVYNKEIDTKENIKKMMHWKDKIKYAIDNDKVVPFFQPIFDKNENLIKYETLMRIKDEVDGKVHYLSPGNFFDVAIKTKQYFKLNQIVIKKAFDNIDTIGKMVSVNISFSDILNLDFMDFIEREVRLLTKEQREKIVFEILESDFISDHKVLDEFILTYRKKGIKFAIDDFGTGYSNFTHVLNIKPEYIKIDGSLIKDIDKNQTSYEMVKSIIDFCKSLKIIVVVEFIHNETVYKILQDLGADEYQGFYLGEPAPLF
ncbi:EAL domain-containing protein [Halarcobacter bivalviorum]|uniref:EAL domain-containing protein n=1 Tax=Halarcobacter bivalviorum TaxID=663364 RepID=UPI00100A384B|nr:EAL domain-containing protein [Halarcobacter bivalviorum]RXK05070.1 hypothetical protein CRU97_09380 [Halarcobacter bivalviorum]